MNTLYVTSAHYRTRAGCPGIQTLSTLIQGDRVNVSNSNSLEGLPLRPSAMTLQKLAQRFKPRK